MVVDEVIEVVKECSFSVGVVGHGMNFVFVPLGKTTTTEQMRYYEAKGWSLAGAIGVLNGISKLRCEPGLESAQLMAQAALRFAEQYRDELAYPLDSVDSERWLTEFFTLPDNRTD